MKKLLRFLICQLSPAPRKRVLVLPRKADYRDQNDFFDFGNGNVGQRITLKFKRR